MNLDYFRIGLKNLRTNRLRGFLTLLGFFIGIAAIVSLVSMGQGLQKAINEQFEMMGTDKIIIFPGNSLLGFAEEGIELTERDLNAIRDVRGVKLASGFVYKVARVTSKDVTKYTWVIGLPQDESREIIESMQSFKMMEGRDLKESDKYKAVIGIRLTEAETFFEKPVKVGESIEIEGQKFRVVGSLEKIGNPQDDSSILIPLDVAKDVLNEPDSYGELFVQTEKNSDVGEVAEDIEKRLRKLRDVKEGEEDFTVQTSEDLRETFESIFNVVSAVLIGIAAISLLVGGIGIMNTMYTSVLQRTQEIGVMKAVGARNSDILSIFLIESGIIGFIGGSIGIVIGIGISKLVEYISLNSSITLFKAYFPWYLIVGSLLFSVVIGMISGLLPAIQASRLKPVDALRYE